MLVDLLMSKDNMSKVVENDMDTTLMNVFGTIFPKSTASLCQFHIAKNVQSKS